METVKLMAEPDAVDIKYTRGDTIPMKFQLVDENDDAINVSGFSFLMTIDPEEDPEDLSNNLFQLTGLITSAPTGEFEFAPDATESDQDIDVFHHDIQMIDGATKIKTIAKGKFEILPDITK